MENKCCMVGGQAVIEGVMMRGPKLVATAVRDPSGKIVVKTEPMHSISDRYPILKKPMLRGVVSLGEALVLGMEYTDDGVAVEAVVPPELLGRVKAYIPGYTETGEDWEK